MEQNLKKTSIKKITSYLFILRIIRMLFSVITVTFTAKYFGVSIEKDYWVLVLTFTTTIVSALWGPINEIFRTKFIYIKETEGEEIALNKSASLVGFIFCMTTILAILLFIFSENIAFLLTNNNSTEAISLFTVLLISMLPSLLINEITSICISVLNAYEVYYLPEIVGVFSGMIHLFIIIILAPIIGIYSLLVSNYLAIISLLIVVLIFLHKKGLSIIWQRLFNFRFSEVKIFLLFAIPFFFPYFVGQLNALSEKYLAGMLGSGSISSLDYARQFINILQSVLSSTLTTIMVPMLAKAFIKNEKKEFAKILKENFSICFCISCLAICMLSGASDSLCRFFFLRGNVTEDNIQIIINLTTTFGFSFIGVLIYIILGMALLASNKSKQYATIGVATQILVLSMNMLFYRNINIYIFPISYGISHLLAGILMFIILKIETKQHIAFYLLKSICYIICFTAILYIFNYWINFDSSLVNVVINIIILILISPLIAVSFGISLKPILKKIKIRK